MTLVRTAPHALIVDDDDGIRSVVDIALGLVGGFDVTEATSGEEALRLLEDHRFDVIVLDVMMPGLDGPSTLTRIRQLSNGASVPVVFLTAKAQPHERRSLEALGVNGVITKPFDPLSLADELRTLAHIES
ncbi:MAG: response regulator [Actinobacteria bacterium]|nr:response regulator [Actinomycetota bacterium]